MYVVILAGGGGTRLWPLSTPERPKPFLPLLDARSLIQATVARLLGPELEIRDADIAVVTDRRYSDLVRTQLPDAIVLEEPVGRNTAAAVALAAYTLDRPDDEVMLVLPADSSVGNEGAFRSALRTAASIAVDDPASLVTLGIEPTGPATGFGYIVPDSTVRVGKGQQIGYPVERFVEKPSREAAERLIAEAPGVSWNAGIFVWRRAAIRAAIERSAPDIASAVAAGLAAGRLDQAYAEVRATSIDYAVMEPASLAGIVRVVRVDAGWSDLGSWSALLEALGASGTGRVVQAGEPAEAGQDDLIVERVAGRLVISAGPRGILGPAPAALLAGARASRPILDDLARRVTLQERQL